MIFMNVKFIAKSNYLLRKVLNSKDSLDILQDLIESILKIKIEKITLNPYLKQRKNELPTEENFGIADVRILTKENKTKTLNIMWLAKMLGRILLIMTLFVLTLKFLQLGRPKLSIMIFLLLKE